MAAALPFLKVAALAIGIAGTAHSMIEASKRRKQAGAAMARLGEALQPPKPPTVAELEAERKERRRLVGLTKTVKTAPAGLLGQPIVEQKQLKSLLGEGGLYT